MERKGNFVLLLHAHLPYIRHPDFEDFLEERWLFEAITETYIPLIKVFKRLEKENIPFKITMSITPPLMEMLTSLDLQEKYARYTKKLIRLTEEEIELTKDEDIRKHKMAKYYNTSFRQCLKIFSEEYGNNILKAFKEFQEKGYIEVVTCNGTHGYLPLMKDYPSSLQAQLKTGVDTYEKNFSVKPKGMWLAECGYTPELDKYMKKEGIEYFFLDSQAFWYSNVQARYSVYRPIMTPEGIFAFGRDPESSEQVWSSHIGYPGDSRYREFYRDIGFDRNYDYIKEYIDKSGARCNLGIKYHKISGKEIPLDKKDFYDIDEAISAVKMHAKDFANKKAEQIKKLFKLVDNEKPIVFAPFDAELFGHWWYEGPLFLEYLFRELSKIDYIELATPNDVINSSEKIQVISPAASSWGAEGYNHVWLNSSNEWIYLHLHQMEKEMEELVKDNAVKNKMEERILNQMARELLLAQSSDWAFIMTTGTTVDYAVNRTQNHINRFFDLKIMYESKNIDETKLRYYEWIDAIFPEMDYKVFKI